MNDKPRSNASVLSRFFAKSAPDAATLGSNDGARLSSAGSDPTTGAPASSDRASVPRPRPEPGEKPRFSIFGRPRAVSAPKPPVTAVTPDGPTAKAKKAPRVASPKPPKPPKPPRIAKQPSVPKTAAQGSKTVGVSYDEATYSVVGISRTTGSTTWLPTTVVHGLHHGTPGESIAKALSQMGAIGKNAVMPIMSTEGRVFRKEFPTRFGASQRRQNVILSIKEPPFGSIPKDRRDEQIAVVITMVDKVSGVVGATLTKTIDERKAIAKAAGLRLTSLEHEGFAWKHALGAQVDAVLSVYSTHVTLIVFTADLFLAFSFNKEYADDYIDRVATTLLDLRATGDVDARVIAVFGEVDDSAYAAIQQAARAQSVTPVYVKDPLGQDHVASPPWYLAYGLALSQVQTMAPRRLVESAPSEAADAAGVDHLSAAQA